MDRFLIWQREGSNEVIVWKNRRLDLREPDLRFPPEAGIISDNEVRFDWDPAWIGGETKRTCIRLRFPQKDLRGLGIEKILFSKVLLPGGHWQNFKGLPVRPEWFDALEDQGDIESDVTTLTYRRLKFHGWPKPFDYLFPSLRRRLEPELAVGVYPGPMFDSWKRYRVFTVGPKAGEYAVASPEPHATLPSVAETKEGWPVAVSVANRKKDIGATWKLKDEKSGPAPESGQIVYVGVDLGTTNTVVYYQKAPDVGVRPTREQPMAPNSLRDIVHWISPPAPGLEMPEWFLPTVPVSREDEMLIPSTVWRLSETSSFWPIRWTKNPPLSKCRPMHGFKWAVEGTEGDTARKEFLRELLFLCIPYVLHQLEFTRTKVNLRLGIAYPLAFGAKQKTRMATTLNELESDLRRDTGLEIRDYSIDESLACVRALGSPNPNEWFLVADMGGGTLDVALFRYQPARGADIEGGEETIHQIGSIAFGGEAYVESFAQRRARNQEERERYYWEFRDSIISGRVEAHYPNDDVVQELAERFLVMALEFLRIMLMAFRQQHPQEPVKVLLVGNGWRLCELAASSQKFPAQVFLDYFNPRIKAFEIAGHSLNNDAIGRVTPAPSKHLVVLGAIKNLRHKPQDKLRDEKDVFPSKLPAGMKVVFRSKGSVLVTIEWFHLVGEGVPWQHLMDTLRSAEIDFERDSGPATPAGWKARLDIAVPEKGRYLEPSELRDHFLTYLKNQWFEKGPLQIILEDHWAKQLGGG